MNIIALIQVMAIWGILFYIIKKKKSGSRPGGSQAPNTTVNTAGTYNQPNNGRVTGNQHLRNGHWGQMSKPQTPVQAAPAKAVTQMAEAEAEEESTTAYLAKKAEEDAREHAREKWEEEKRLRESRGGLAVAGRHLEGDPLPQGSRCVVCGYCGAENLVPMILRTRYSCYFCREALN